jgi:hypothetical protein
MGKRKGKQEVNRHVEKVGKGEVVGKVTMEFHYKLKQVYLMYLFLIYDVELY